MNFQINHNYCLTLNLTIHSNLQCSKKLEAIFREELGKKKKQNVGLIRSGAKNNYDLMEGLMQIEDEKGNKLSDKEVIDNIVSLVIAGYESTSLVF